MKIARKNGRVTKRVLMAEAGVGKMPPGNKGKTKLKKLYRKVAPNKAYHSGERAKDLISHLDMAGIRASAPIPLGEIDRAVVSG